MLNAPSTPLAAGFGLGLEFGLQLSLISVDPRGCRWAGWAYLDTENIQNQTPARICMHRKVSFFRSMKLTTAATHTAHIPEIY